MRVFTKAILLSILLLSKTTAFSQQPNIQKYLNDDYVKEKQNKLFMNYEPFIKGIGIGYERVFWHALALEMGLSIINTDKLNSLFAHETNQIISNETMQIQNLTRVWIQPKLYIYENFHISLLYSSTINNIPEKITEYTAYTGYKFQISSHLFADFDIGLGMRYCTVKNYYNSSDYNEPEYSMFNFPLSLKVGYEF